MIQRTTVSLGDDSSAARGRRRDVRRHPQHGSPSGWHRRIVETARDEVDREGGSIAVEQRHGCAPDSAVVDDRLRVRWVTEA